jgi:hypothetical protein
MNRAPLHVSARTITALLPTYASTKCTELTKVNATNTTGSAVPSDITIVAATARGGGVHDTATNAELLLLTSTPGATYIDMVIASDSSNEVCDTPLPLQPGTTARMKFPG